MRHFLLTALAISAIAGTANAQPADTIGGADGTSQTISHCGYLPTQNVIYTNSPVVTRIIQEKLAALGFYHGAIDGVAGRGTKQAVRRFQSEYGLAVDGVVGADTAQRIAYFTHQSPNVQRCWRLAQG